MFAASQFAMVGIAGSIAQPITLSGTLDRTAAPSGGTVSSNTVTVTVPSGNTGDLRFQSFGFTGSVTTLYSKNGGGPTSMSDPTTVNFANGDTLQVRMGSAVAGEEWSFTLIDVTTGQVVGNYQITAP